MMKRCEVCGKLVELLKGQESGMGDVKSLYVCEDCRKDRRKSIDKVVTQ
ncbi:MAG TPA: hypothetical protein VNM45_01520 [Bacillus sp. (in: firmicutes)]|nr:hypothetical protein [Bacillus sp. (in: firmicutes)]